MRMMKAMLLAAVLVTSATAVHAGDMTFGLNGGVAIPMSNFKDFAKLGFGGGVYGDYWVKPAYALGADIAGNFFKAKDEIINPLKTPAYPDPKATVNLINFGVHGLWSPPMESAAKPWISAGVGMYHIASKIEGTANNSDDSQNKFGINGGVGVDMKASEMVNIGVGAKAHDVFSKDDTKKTKNSQFFTVGVNVTFKTAK